MRSFRMMTMLATAAVSLPLGACRDVALPIGDANAVEIRFDPAVPRRDPRNVHTYRLRTMVSREAVQAIAGEQIYTYVHVTRCAGGELIAVAETWLDRIDLMDFEALERKLAQDPRSSFELEAKFSAPARLRTGEACVAFNGGSYLAAQASSRPTPITVSGALRPDT